MWEMQYYFTTVFFNCANFFFLTNIIFQKGASLHFILPCLCFYVPELHLEWPASGLFLCFGRKPPQKLECLGNRALFWQKFVSICPDRPQTFHL